MQTFSSAKRTCSESVSAVECTATVRIPMSRHARITRSAISPRLAMRTFLNTRGLLAQAEQVLAVLHVLAVLNEDLLDAAFGLRLDLVHQLHRFDDADHLALAHGLPDVDELRRLRRRRAIERTDERRADVHTRLRDRFDRRRRRQRD